MRIPSRLASAVLITFAFLATTANAQTPAPPDDSDPIVHEVGPTPASSGGDLFGYTQEELMNAIPAETRSPSPAPAFDVPEFPEASVSARPGDFIVRNPAKLPLRLHGKAFFRIGNLIYSCSGTVISSRYGNAIYTAGHCVFDVDTKRFVKNLIFIPGYKEGTTPFRGYAAAKLITNRGWARRGDFSTDIGMAVLSGFPVRDLGGARPVAFNLNLKKRRYTLFGYPADPKPVFDGENLYGCHSRFAGRDRGRPRTMAATPCHMGHGASGGGWITNGYLNSVNSYIYCETTPRACGYVFGPYFARTAKRMYKNPAVGGSITSTIAFRHAPPARVKHRKVRFRFFSLASTPLRYNCKFDRRSWRRCGARTSISRLRLGRHILRVRAVDQTGRKSGNKLIRRFRVIRG